MFFDRDEPVFMFVFRFIYPTGTFPRYFLRQAFFARRGRLPMRSAVSFSELSENRGLLKVTVDWEEGGTIHVPYLHRRYGLTFFSTETLRPRSKPLHLVRELARGQLSRVIKRVHDWQGRGLRIPQFILNAVKEGVGKMTELAVMDDEEPGFDERAVAVFESLVFLSHLLLDQFIEQSLIARKTLSNEFPIQLGFRAKRAEKFVDFEERHPDYRNIFQAWNPSVTWRDIEPEEGVFCWDALDAMVPQAKANHWRVFLGPIVRWDRQSLPHWVLQKLDDPYSVRKSLFRYAEAVIHRYPFVNHWIVSSGIASDLDYVLVSKRIEWADSLARLIRAVNSSAKLLIGIERPWGDALRFETEIPPLELAERLAMNRYVDGFFLSISFGLSQDASLPRDAFELNWLLDQWSQFGKPLYFSFSVPSYPSFDVPHWETPETVELPWNLKTQQETVHRYFLSFLTRKSISGVFWNQLDDISAQKVPPAIFEQSNEETKSFSELTETREIHDDEMELAPDVEVQEAVSLLTEPPGERPRTKTPVEKPAAGPVLFESAVPPIPPIPPEGDVGPKPPEITSLEDAPVEENFSFPHSGLITAEGNPKPAFKKLTALGHAYLG